MGSFVMLADDIRTVLGSPLLVPFAIMAAAALVWGIERGLEDREDEDGTDGE